MQQLFSQQIHFKEGDELRNGKIKDFGSFYYGKSAPKHSLVSEGGIPCVRYGELYSCFGEQVDKIYSFTSIPRDKLKFSKGGEVLVPRVGEKPLDFANCSYLPFKDIAIGEMISVYNTEENGLYMTYYFNAVLKKDFARVVEGGNVSNLYFRYLEEINISIHSRSEQQKIASFLTSLDQKIEQVGKQLSKAQDFKKGLLQQMFV